MRIVVIGGGLAGIAAATRLAHAGYEVQLFEKNNHIGGKMNVQEADGFTFDMGPTILTMPQVLDRLFESVGRRRADYLELVRIDPQWRSFFEDSQVIDVWGNREKMRAEIRRIQPEDDAGYERFRHYAEAMYRLSEQFFFWRSVGGISDIMNPKDFLNTQGLEMLRTLDLTSTVASAINRHFKNPHLRQIYEHFMQYVGSDPHKVPAILCAIHHIQLEFGVWYPMGGTNRVAAALRRLAEECGVSFHLGTPVERILGDRGRVTGIRAGGETIPADLIVANSDFARTHHDLLPPTRTQRSIRKSPKKFEPACSGIVFYFGMDQKFDQLAHHDFFFSKDPSREFEDIYHQKVPTQDPTLCVCSPSRTDPSVAPAGCENIYVLVHTPYLQPDQDWEKIRGPYRDLVIDKLERAGLKDFRKRIRVERWFTPKDLETTYRVDRGAIYGITSHGRLRGGFKPKNRSKDFKNLYFCGGSVNPGPGVPMALMSGQIAAQCVLEDVGVAAPTREESLV